MADITPADIELLTRELNLKETTPTTLHALHMSFGGDWFRKFKTMNRQEVEMQDENGRVKRWRQFLQGRPGRHLLPSSLYSK